MSWTIEHWVSRIEDSECRNFFINSDNYEEIKSRLSVSFEGCFIDNSFSKKRHIEEVLYINKMSKGKIRLRNVEGLNGKVYPLTTANVFDKSKGKKAVFVGYKGSKLLYEDGTLYVLNQIWSFDNFIWDNDYSTNNYSSVSSIKKLVGNQLNVPEVKSTIKKGKIPNGKVLHGKIKSAKIVNNILTFREVFA